MKDNKKTCLVVDDEDTVRSVAAVVSKRLGFDTKEAKSGKEAFEMCKQSMPDVVLLDWYMPDMDGIEFLKVFRMLENNNNTIVLMCSGENKKEKVKEAIESGANSYLLKPLEIESLRKRLLQLGVNF